MYLYLDESGEHKTPIAWKKALKPQHTEFFFVFCILVIEDKKSKFILEDLVAKTTQELSDYYIKRGLNLPKTLEMGELKGRILKRVPAIETGFFEKIAEPEIKCGIYMMLLDKRRLKQPLPEMDKRERRVAWFFRFLLLNVFAPPKKQKVMMLLIDSRPETETPEAKFNFNKMVRDMYKNKMRAVNLKRLKKKVLRYRRYGKKFTPPVGTKLLIAHVDSKRHLCLQAADVLAHFGHTKCMLFGNVDANFAEPDKLARHKERWLKLHEIIDPKIAVWREPQFLSFPRLRTRQLKYPVTKIESSIEEA